MLTGRASETPDCPPHDAEPANNRVTAYQPYPRAYGLLRRVAHWTSQAMVGEARSVGGKGLALCDGQKSVTGSRMMKNWVSDTKYAVR